MKKLKATAKNANGERKMIAALVSILDKFNSYVGVEELINADTLALIVGNNRADLYFCPELWEICEEAIMRWICSIIDLYVLNEFPYYKEMAERFTAAIA